MLGRRDRSPTPSFSPEEPEFWRQLTVASSVALRDFQAMEEASERGARGDSINYQVTAKRAVNIRSSSDIVIAEYLFFDLSDSNTTYWLLGRLEADQVELRVYYTPDGFTPGTRGQILGQGFAWLFATPDNPDDFVPHELEFAPYPAVPPIRDNGRDVAADFDPVGGPQYGDYLDAPGGRHVPVILCEYVTEAEVANPLLLVMEEGGLDAAGDAIPDGGLVTLHLGSRIETSHIDVYPA